MRWSFSFIFFGIEVLYPLQAIFGVMECINEFIRLEFEALSGDTGNSICRSEWEQECITMVYRLYHNNCFLDLVGCSYQIKIVIDASYFEKYGEPFEWTTFEQSICCYTQSRLLEMVQCRLTGLNRKIFLEGIILQLVHLTQLNPLVDKRSCEQCLFANKPHEIEKIELAKTYILNHLDENITIPLLASQVGTNQCYLKKGFKEIVGTTIFEFVQENRMNMARNLLQAGFFSVSDVAMKVGYRSVSSFSLAFKNYFGANPSQFLKPMFSTN